MGCGAVHRHIGNEHAHVVSMTRHWKTFHAHTHTHTIIVHHPDHHPRTATSSNMTPVSGTSWNLLLERAKSMGPPIPPIGPPPELPPLARRKRKNRPAKAMRGKRRLPKRATKLPCCSPSLTLMSTPFLARMSTRSGSLGKTTYTRGVGICGGCMWGACGCSHTYTMELGHTCGPSLMTGMMTGIMMVPPMCVQHTHTHIAVHPTKHISRHVRPQKTLPIHTVARRPSTAVSCNWLPSLLKRTRSTLPF